MVSAEEGLRRLREGNVRFVAGLQGHDPSLISVRREQVANSQTPFAIILGCSDSRVPAEMVFDQGLGDLFVIRVAGNIVAPSQIGSVEFAAAQFGTRLVIVLGHTQCGAILATLEELRQPQEAQSPNLRAIVSRIKPSIEPLLEKHSSHNDDALIREAVVANVETSVRDLQHGSEIIEQLIETGGLMIVGAEYSLETGEVRFLE